VPERLTRLTPDDLTPEQAEVHARFTRGRRVAPEAGFSLVAPDGGLLGPPNGWLRSPALAGALEHLGGILRFELELAPRSREIAILLVGHHRESPFELFAHQRAGRAAGLSDDEMAGLATRTAPAFRSQEEEAVFTATLAILDRRTLDATEYATAVAVLGERGLLELVVLLGYYELVATQLAVFDVRPPD
jgi:alkylhydroperoxidase family enzyme